MENNTDDLLELPENRGFKELIESLKGGRPRKFDRIEYAIKIANWALREDSLNLNGFCAEEGIPASYLGVWAKENDQFSIAYEAAKAKLARRREEALREGRLHVKAYDVNAKAYDLVKRDADRAELEFELRLKKTLDSEETSQIDGRLFELLDKLKGNNESEK